MTNLSKRLSVIALIVLLAGFACTAAVHAQQTVKPGITVSPAQLSIRLLPNQQTQTATTTVQNNLQYPVTLSAQLVGIDTASGHLVPKNGAEQAAVSAMTVSPSAFTLQPQQAINLLLTYQDNKTVAPGGHYVGLIIQQAASSDKSVAVRGAISVNVFLLKTTGAVVSLNLQSYKLHRALWNLPTAVDMVFTNNGNVPVVPRGAVDVSRVDSKSIYLHGIVNPNSLPLYRDTSSTYKTSLPNKQPLWPGRYTVVIRYHSDQDENWKTVQQTIVYFPVWLVFAFLAAGFGLVILLWVRYRARRSKSSKSPKKQPTKVDIASKPSKQTAQESISQSKQQKISVTFDETPQKPPKKQR